MTLKEENAIPIDLGIIAVFSKLESENIDLQTSISS
jgi:hypothetical protein